ncbi:hypothetical protein GCM10010399_94240 [Dactylosporangium fulvum]
MTGGCASDESHGQAIQRVAGFLADLPTRWAGHRTTCRALEQVINGLTVRELVAAEWRPGSAPPTDVSQRNHAEETPRLRATTYNGS